MDYFDQQSDSFLEVLGIYFLYVLRAYLDLCRMFTCIHFLHYFISLCIIHVCNDIVKIKSVDTFISCTNLLTKYIPCINIRNSK